MFAAEPQTLAELKDKIAEEIGRIDAANSALHSPAYYITEWFAGAEQRSDATQQNYKAAVSDKITC